MRRVRVFKSSLILALALPLSSAAVRAAASFELSLGDLAGAGWAAQALVLHLALDDAASGSARIEIGQAQLPAAAGTLSALVLQCPQLRRDATGWTCAQGEAQLGDSPVGPQQLSWSGSFRAPDDWRLSLTGLRLAQGTAQLTAQGGAGGWQLSLAAERLQPAALARTIPALRLPRDWQLAGHLRLDLGLAGQGVAPQELSADLALDQVGFASPDGLQAAEGLVLKAMLQARVAGAAWQGRATLDWRAGQLYAEPLFLEVQGAPLALQLRGSWRPANATLALDAWSARQAGVLDAEGTASLGLLPFSLSRFAVTAQATDLGRLYDSLVQPFLIGTPGDDLEIQGSGHLNAEADRAGLQALQLQLPALDLADRKGRFGFAGIAGELSWSRDPAAARPSQLRVDRARLYRIETAGFGLAAQAAGDGLRLLEPLVVPTLAGQVRLDRLEVSGLTSPGLQWRAAAAVEGLSLEALTRDLDWPAFSGTLSGDLPDVRYAERLFSAGGGLQLNVFGGRVEVNGLQVSDPLGAVPVVEGAAELRGLDLAALTGAFSFGRIEGRLDGRLHDLQLIAWQPNRFRLHLFTPPQDRSRRRISQRAVENLTELGSGLPAGLSGTVLRLFDDFSYSRIELKVALDGNAALLDGIARPDGGYYLVQGAGLPRIDVIGRNRRVAWKDLVERLRRIQVEGAQIR